jgi:glutamate synthase domain-containing protein 1
MHHLSFEYIFPTSARFSQLFSKEKPGFLVQDNYHRYHIIKYEPKKRAKNVQNEISWEKIDVDYSLLKKVKESLTFQEVQILIDACETLEEKAIIEIARRRIDYGW